MLPIKRLAAIFRTVVTWSDEMASVLIIIMMCLISGDVIGRYVFASPIPGTLEVSEGLMVFIVFLAYAYCEAQDKHVRIQLLERSLRPRQIYLTNVLACLIGMFVYGVICWQGCEQAWFSWVGYERMLGPLQLPIFPVRIALVWGSLILVLQFFVGLCSNVSRIVRGESN